ncbi:hypothetical protein J7F03_20565 [Streptomyces sp. ISL-43]|uniref:hypothetical protein n=1 Tax=Streptomyces sp. ISL-43 TaxID=2819183 RepID=UPI001BE739F0|nr:hypothetical protein [Streptomyces sp. ISL-43]MBT2449437.1 hypothetical protein [Streptomyces sp. ISL-43]
MTHSPTPTELLALRTANAALLNSPDSFCDMVATIVFALGSAQLLQSPTRAAELTARRNEDMALRGELAPMGEPRKVPFELGDSLVPAVQWLIAQVAEQEEVRVDLWAHLDFRLRDIERLRARVAELEAERTRPAPLFPPDPAAPVIEPLAGTLRIRALMAEDPHESPLHHEHRLSRDLPEMPRG